MMQVTTPAPVLDFDHRDVGHILQDDHVVHPGVQDASAAGRRAVATEQQVIDFRFQGTVCLQDPRLDLSSQSLADRVSENGLALHSLSRREACKRGKKRRLCERSRLSLLCVYGDFAVRRRTTTTVIAWHLTQES